MTVYISRIAGLSHLIILFFLYFLLPAAAFGTDDPDAEKAKDSFRGKWLSGGIFDLNDDGINDINIYVRHIASCDMPVSSRSEILHIEGCGASKVNCSLMEEGYSIDMDTGWPRWGESVAINNWSLERGGDEFWQSKWTEDEQKYFGVQIVNDGYYYYGWVEFSVRKTDGKFMIHDYACNPDRGEPILTGYHPE
ncbi:MAG: hypothetical protein R3F48_06570 [Candidatus Zixiibacteriota bacterium]